MGCSAFIAERVGLKRRWEMSLWVSVLPCSGMGEFVQGKEQGKPIVIVIMGMFYNYSVTQTPAYQILHFISDNKHERCTLALKFFCCVGSLSRELLRVMRTNLSSALEGPEHPWSLH